MAWPYDCSWLIVCATVLSLLKAANGVDIFLEWHIAIDTTIKPVSMDQPVINDKVTSFPKTPWKGIAGIGGGFVLFPGPFINATTNDNIHVNVFNDMAESLLKTWYRALSLSGLLHNRFSLNSGKKKKKKFSFSETNL